MTISKAQELVKTRHNTHGSFEDTARIATRLKFILTDELAHRQARGQEGLTAIQIEALNLDMTKTARIIAGDADCIEHWEDKQGYCQLAIDEIKADK